MPITMQALTKFHIHGQLLAHLTVASNAATLKGDILIVGGGGGGMQQGFWWRVWVAVVLVDLLYYSDTSGLSGLIPRA